MTIAASLTREVRALQNPALGSLLLWRCTVSYESLSDTGAPIPLQLLFLVLPITLHKQTGEVLASTRMQSGLRKFVEKFQLSSQSKTDLILAIAPRAREMRALTIESLQFAIRASLISIDEKGAAALALSTTQAAAGIPHSVRALMSSAEKLGSWFAQLSLYEVAVMLQVEF